MIFRIRPNETAKSWLVAPVKTSLIQLKNAPQFRLAHVAGTHKCINNAHLLKHSWPRPELLCRYLWVSHQADIGSACERNFARHLRDELRRRLSLSCLRDTRRSGESGPSGGMWVLWFCSAEIVSLIFDANWKRLLGWTSVQVDFCI